MSEAAVASLARWRGPSAPLFLWASLALGLLASAHIGAVPVQWRDWGAALADAPLSGSAHVLWHLRLPRVLLALAIGAMLGLAGALTQALFRNPMADPGLLGVTSGGTCAAALTLTVFSGLHWALPNSARMWVLPVAAFVGTLGVTFALDRLARWLAPGSVAGLLLTGLALSAITMAVVGFCSFVATDEQLRNLNFWTMGSLAAASWKLLLVLGGALLLAAVTAHRVAPLLNALALGDAAAAHVGVNVSRLRKQMLVLVALLCALAVAWCGLIGFIGLMAPHMVRQLVGADQKRVLPLSMLTGALLLLVADTVARVAAIPAEVPVGIFTALIGGPWFLMLLRHRMQERS